MGGACTKTDRHDQKELVKIPRELVKIPRSNASTDDFHGPKLQTNWEFKSSCICPSSYYDIHHVYIKSINVKTTATRPIFDHYYLEFPLSCTSCTETFTITITFGEHGRELRWGKYNKFKLQQTKKLRLSYDKLFELYKKVWADVINGDDHPTNKNCHHYATDFFNALKDE